MGTYRSTYIGIYLVVPHKVKEVNRTVRKNPVTDKIHEGDERFCKDTGVELVDHVLTEKKTVYPDAYMKLDGFDGEEFFTPAYCGAPKNHETFMVNSHGKYNTGEDNAGQFNYDVTAQDIDKINEIVEDFKEEFKPYIDYYTKEFGEVGVHYGVVHYAH